MDIPRLSEDDRCDPDCLKKFRTIEGRELARETGEAVLEVMGERATRIIVFGEPGDAEVLGADALEGLGLEVDPAGKSLRKTEVFVAYAASTGPLTYGLM